MNSDANTKTWRPVGRVLRRVLGVLVEKAKTTPDLYPMTVSAIVTASNQKSNRSPKMELTSDEVEETLEALREIGAVVEIQGDGRKYKYKHLLYDWLGVDKVQLAVMAELLLRGEQTLGDLRARASRMEPIDGQADLKPIVDELIAKNLILPLTPAGRGQIVTHSLYQPEELAKLERQMRTAAEQAPSAVAETRMTRDASIETQAKNSSPESVADLVRQVRELAEQLNRLEERVTHLES